MYYTVGTLFTFKCKIYFSFSAVNLNDIKLSYMKYNHNKEWTAMDPMQRDTVICENSLTPVIQKLKIEYAGTGNLSISDINVYGSGMKVYV